jgi:hypothetical protein
MSRFVLERADYDATKFLIYDTRAEGRGRHGQNRIATVDKHYAELFEKLLNRETVEAVEAAGERGERAA